MVAVTIVGNISREATAPSSNIFADAMRVGEFGWPPGIGFFRCVSPLWWCGHSRRSWLYTGRLRQ
jgi:hypothetical protein